MAANKKQSPTETPARAPGRHIEEGYRTPPPPPPQKGYEVPIPPPKTDKPGKKK